MKNDSKPYFDEFDFFCKFVEQLWMSDNSWSSRPFTRIYQDPSRLPAIGHHGWPSAGEKSKCLKIPPHVPQVMIKLPLKCIHRPHSDHLIIQPVPLITHPICKLEPPNFQPVPSAKQLEGMPSSAIILHNLEKPPRINILKAFKNLEDFNQIRPQESGFQGSKTQYPQSVTVRITLQSLNHLCSPPLYLFQLVNIFPVMRSPCLHAVIQMRSHYWLI